MKQGKTEKAVFAKLSTQKVELAEQKVELSIASQISNYADDIRTVQTKLQVLEAAESKASRLFAIKEDAIQLTKELQSVRAEQDERYVSSWVDGVPQLLNELEQSVKELGIDPSSVKGYDELKKAYSSISSTYKSIEGVGAMVTRELGRKI
jgi:phosphoglycolate phosphatase-like HAD superfamily hydrolase